MVIAGVLEGDAIRCGIEHHRYIVFSRNCIVKDLCRPCRDMNLFARSTLQANQRHIGAEDRIDAVGAGPLAIPLIDPVDMRHHRPARVAKERLQARRQRIIAPAIVHEAAISG